MFAIQQTRQGKYIINEFNLLNVLNKLLIVIRMQTFPAS